MYKYVIGAILILALLLLLQRGCQSGAERRWERKQERYQWRKDNRKSDSWRRRSKPHDHDSTDDSSDGHKQADGRRGWFFRRRSSEVIYQ